MIKDTSKQMAKVAVEALKEVAEKYNAPIYVKYLFLQIIS